MSSPISSVSQVVARIDQIERQFGPTQQQVMGQSAGFDAFGELYQAALQASPTSLGKSSASTPGSSTGLYSAQLGAAGHGDHDGHVHGSSTGQIGGFGSMQVPAGLQQYGNGRIPPNLLTPIRQAGHRLYAPAAAAWDQLVGAASADGVQIRITDSYRSYEQQVDLAERKGLYKNGGLAAVPGTSNHGWGLAVDADVTDPEAIEWMRANAPKFGFVEAVPREPWHWEYRPQQA